ncbi:M23 family metallopeptidase [Kocuria oceani]|uniref:M23 family metallopeptidase n=1 Tax=Kocuria oceani TaxID=988827 RepID=A0ABV9TFB6_9MICC|nr:M23 family metallopeptidase [Kocuria oceani]
MPRNSSHRPSTAGLRRRAASPVTALTAFSALVAVSVAVSSGIAPDAGPARGSAFGTPSEAAEQVERTESRWSLMAAAPGRPQPAGPLREVRSVSPVRDGGAGEGSWREGAGRGEGGRDGVSTVRPGRQPPRLYQGELPVNTLIAPTSPGAVLPGGQFGWRIAPDRGGREFHNGTDVSAPAGLPVVAALDGEVTAVFWDVWGGNRVEVTHADGLKTTYNHLEDVRVRVGDRLAASEQLGAVGATGIRVTGPHLHFETWVDGQAVDPQSFDWVDGMRVIPASRSKYSLEVPVPQTDEERAAADRKAAADKVAAKQKAAQKKAAQKKAAEKKAAEKKAAEQKTAQQKAAAEKRAAARKAAADKAAADKAAESTKATAPPPPAPAPEQPDDGPATVPSTPPAPPRGTEPLTGTEQPLPPVSSPTTPPAPELQPAPEPGTKPLGPPEAAPAPTPTPTPTPTAPGGISPTPEPGVAPVVADTVRDTDKDGIPDVDDDNLDGDFHSDRTDIFNHEDTDLDGDGIDNEKDPDLDGDGLRNEADPDMDGDGLPNDEDDDRMRPARRAAAPGVGDGVVPVEETGAPGPAAAGPAAPVGDTGAEVPAP